MMMRKASKNVDVLYCGCYLHFSLKMTQNFDNDGKIS